MRTLPILIAVAFSPLVMLGQSSNDHWDRTFRPKAAAERKTNQMSEWVKSWSGRYCQKDDVKRFWQLTLLADVPGTMDPGYNQSLRYNADITGKINSGAWDFEAQDMADQMNAFVLRASGKQAEAAALENARAQRQAARQQVLLQNQAFSAMFMQQLGLSAKIKQMNDQLWFLREDISRLRR